MVLSGSVMVSVEVWWCKGEWVVQVWPLVSVINYRYMPLHLRVLFNNLAAVCWYVSVSFSKIILLFSWGGNIIFVLTKNLVSAWYVIAQFLSLLHICLCMVWMSAVYAIFDRHEFFHMPESWECLWNFKIGQAIHLWWEYHFQDNCSNRGPTFCWKVCVVCGTGNCVVVTSLCKVLLCPLISFGRANDSSYRIAISNKKFLSEMGQAYLCDLAKHPCN
jgi:hypothetical protein